MTLLANPVAFIYKGEPCTMTVARNNGDCWGYIEVLRTGREFSIFTSRDWYEADDEEAAQAFIRAVKRKHHIDGQELFAMEPGVFAEPDAEGWGLFNAPEDAAIQRDDEADKFPSDDEAIDFVRLQAHLGSERHQQAYGAHCANPRNKYRGRLPRSLGVQS